MATPTHNRVERFWSKIAIKEKDDCWEWQGAQNADGYGKLLWSAKPSRWRRPHKVVYELIHGDITDEKLCVCHTCDNRLCCNPEHLFLGTRLDNSLDAKAKGRINRMYGLKNPKTKLTEDQVREIISLKGRVSQQKIGERFGIHQTHISRLHNGHNWQVANVVNE